jgi:hypothetical protein
MSNVIFIIEEDDNKNQEEKEIQEDKEKTQDEKEKDCKKEKATQEDVIVSFYNHVQSIGNDQISLLKDKEIISWLFGDTSFLPKTETKNKTQGDKQMKVLEDEWGQNKMKLRRPDLKSSGQWTTKLGEHICEELCLLQNKKFFKPLKKQNYQPDTETEDAIWEAKTQTFFTTGTAGEKILGVPFKYCEIPELYGKPLKILCMGGAERECREHYFNLGEKCSNQKKKYLDFYRENGVEFIGATDLIKKILVS